VEVVEWTPSLRRQQSACIQTQSAWQPLPCAIEASGSPSIQRLMYIELQAPSESGPSPSMPPM